MALATGIAQSLALAQGEDGSLRFDLKTKALRPDAAA